jgi:UDPglucose 6-dehydrogenase
MRICIIGSGKLGLSYAAFISSKGHSVHCVDKNEKMIEKYSNGIFDDVLEPRVSEMCKKFPMNYSTEIDDSADIKIILVNTPTSYTGYDHGILEDVLKNTKGNVIITCTVQPGFCNRLKRDDIIYNPLFVQIGNIIENLTGTKDVLVGSNESNEHFDFFKSIYGDEVNVHYMSHIEAEVAKLALNSYITTKISFANMVGDSLRRCGKDSKKVLDFVGSDSRIGNKCFKYGWGYGGPCFPRDNRAFCTFLREKGMYDYIPVAAHESNERHAMEQAIYVDCIGDDLSYKENCAVPILEESHKLKTLEIMKSIGKFH